MDPRTHAPQIQGTTLGQIAGILGLVVACVVAPAVAADTQTGGSPAMRMYRDPNTGVIGAPSAEAVTPPAADEKAQINPPPALEREPVLAPPGGVKVNLQGRYHAIVTRHMNGARPGGHECAQSGAAAQ
jgi:hypothetical protein